MKPGIESTFHLSIGMEVIDPFGNRLRFDESLPAMAGDGSGTIEPTESEPAP